MIPEQNAKNDTTMLLVRMSTDNTADGVTLSRPSVHNSPRSTVAISLRAREHRDEVGIAVDQPRAGDRRHDEQQRDRQHVDAHRAHGGRHAIAHQRQQHVPRAARGPVNGVVKIGIHRLQVFAAELAGAGSAESRAALNSCAARR